MHVISLSSMRCRIKSSRWHGDKVVDFNSKLTQGALIFMQTNAIQCVTDKTFQMCRAWHARALRMHDLWDDKKVDLAELWRPNIDEADVLQKT